MRLPMQTTPMCGLFAAALLANAALAQNPALTPTHYTVLDTTPTQGVFAFSHIDIPAGVEVAFIGSYPVRITCDGDAGIRGWLRADGRLGKLVPPQDPTALADAIEQVLLDEDAARALVPAARQRVEHDFGPTKSVRRLEELVQSVVR